MRYFVGLAVAAITLMFPHVAAACSCREKTGPVPLPRGYGGIVATGRVTDLQLVSPEMRVIAAYVEVDEGLVNATARSRIVVYTPRFDGECRYPFTIGTAYLFVTDPLASVRGILGDQGAGFPTGSQIVHGCGWTIELNSTKGRQRAKEIRGTVKKPSR